MGPKRGIEGIFSVFCLFHILLLSQNASAVGYISLTIQAEPSCVNINQSNEPVVIHCSLSYEGISVLPYAVYLDACFENGDVYLTQYEFVFHYPETIPFDAIVLIDPDTANDTQGNLVISGYSEEGGLQYGLFSVSRIINIYNYDPDYDEGKELSLAAPSQPSNEIIFYYGIPSLLFFLGVYLSFVRPRLLKYGKKRK